MSIVVVEIRRLLRDGVIGADDLEGLRATGRSNQFTISLLSHSIKRNPHVGQGNVNACATAIGIVSRMNGSLTGRGRRTEPARQRCCRKACVCCQNVPAESGEPSCRRCVGGLPGNEPGILSSTLKPKCTPQKFKKQRRNCYSGKSRCGLAPAGV